LTITSETKKSRITGREALLDAIAGTRPSRQPVVLFSAGAWTFNSLGLTLEEVLGDAQSMASTIVRTFEQKAPSDAVWVGSGFNNLPVKALGGAIKYPAKGTPQVARTVAFSEDGSAERPRIDDLALDPDVRSLWETTSLVKNAIRGRALIGACGWGPFTLAGQMYGTEKLMFQVYQDPGAVRRVLDFSVEASARYYQGFLEEGAEIISIAEPLASGDMISRKHFEQFVVPALATFLSRLKQSKAYNLLHICGNITNRLDLIPDIGVDVLSVDYKVDLKKVREAVGARIAFAGNVNPADPLQQGTPEAVIQASLQCIADAGSGNRFILMPGCDIPPSVPLENVRAFFEAARTYNSRETD
jgi:uroporphyrinogen decarboxylase